MAVTWTGVLVLFLMYDAARSSGFGKCPKYPSMENFEMDRFTGKWYEVERSFYLMEIPSGCTTIDMLPNDRGEIEVTTKTLNRWTGNPSTSEGTGVLLKHDKTKMRYTVKTRLPAPLARLLPGAGTYQVLYTDYDNFAIIWTCSSMGIAHTDLIWVLGRTREIPVSRRAEIYSTLQKLHIDSDRLIISKNRDCPYD